MMTEAVALSPEGREFLADPVMYAALSVIAAAVGASPEEYLARFEKVLLEEPEAIFGTFQKTQNSGEIV